jgi:hypothetical protein
MAGDWSSFQEESFRASCVPHSHHSLNNSSTIHLCRCLILGRAREYNHIVKAFQPMMPSIPSEDTIVVLC